ncbi:GLPGLI family protein [Pedobacter frigoris]|uniref:GLPGLI family protein n=1 Tax=Pedobacter frigoris TaxID=2571272 RepID=UPI00292E4ECA|nr:GLPGLI family protein [Pedobacter frigoris]
MKKPIIFFAFILLLKVNSAFAQNKHFITSGVIEFERTANMFALVKKKITKSTMENQRYYDQYLRTEPQFRKLKSTLTFDANTSAFVPFQVPNVHWWYDSPMANQINIVFSDLKNGTSIVQKEFYERTYLVKDSIRQIKWKITDETREIAGYKCRRANGVMLDSIYVVAFYTEDIHVSGGPESFNGLPGMILGVAVPHENVTWFATSVKEKIVDPKMLLAPKKGKEVNNKVMKEEIMKAIGNHGDFAIVELKGLLL